MDPKFCFYDIGKVIVFFLSDGSLVYCQRERARRFSVIRVFMFRGKSYEFAFGVLFKLGI